MEKMIPKSIQILVAIVAISIYGTSGQSECLTSTNISCTEGSYRGRHDTIETRLLFSMNFTCHGTIVGWTVTGEKIQGRTQYPELQVWRADPSQGSDYYFKPSQDIPVNPGGPACEIVTQTCGQIFQCRLRAANQVSVQPGDILGVELPQLTNSGFHPYFISIPGTQDHYIYRQQLSSSVHTSTHLIRQLDDQLLISLEIESVSPNTATDGSTTTISTTNEPTTATNDSLTTENMSTTTTEGTRSEETLTITDAQQSTTNNATKAVTCSQSTSTTGVITGVAIGGILIGALITVLVTLIILAIAHLTKKKQSALTLLAMNRISSEEDKINDIDVKKDVEEPVYSVILPNPDHKVVMNRNECYGTSLRSK